ncbi:RNA polymerase sigma factor [Sphingomonas donggukensis]|uniref:RNA polymerase sigma factor n=1 Tax=Sphingomonas donggukensis TaxID=2949093 RepID=A0ABY4TXG4_9SPHN|nr:RNA polymerase sigma factor [Sphingomonas donggukensis]URW75844.1 RNA polymerase sigma factor [Sphingomonas donggukensis]
MKSDYGALSDGELAALAAVGGEAAFREIVRRHSSQVYRLIVGNVSDPDEALDLVQETFISAHGALRRFDPSRPMAAWLSVIALNKCRDWARRRTVRRFFAFARPIDEVAGELASDAPGIDVAAADRQELERLRQAITELPTALREPLVLHSVEGMSQADTASVLAITEKAVETRLRRARIRLAEILARHPPAGH